MLSEVEEGFLQMLPPDVSQRVRVCWGPPSLPPGYSGVSRLGRRDLGPQGQEASWTGLFSVVGFLLLIFPSCLYVSRWEKGVSGLMGEEKAFPHCLLFVNLSDNSVMGFVGLT